MAKGRIYTGIGGWTYEPWRGVFYPKGLPHARELAYAAAHLTSIEINGTFYRTQTPATFRKWASRGAGGILCSALKGPRYAVNRRVLAEAGELDQAFPQFRRHRTRRAGSGRCSGSSRRTKKFDEKDFGNFLDLLPPKFDGHALRHVVEVRNDSFKTPAFIALLRQFGVAVVYAEHDTYTEIADITADFVYARLQKGDEKLKAGYAPKALDAWAKRAQIWAKGGEPKDLPRVDKKSAAKKPRDTFIYFIHEAKLRAPAAAMALIERVIDALAKGHLKRKTTKTQSTGRRRSKPRERHPRASALPLFTIGYEQAKPAAVMRRAQARQDRPRGRHPRGRGLAPAGLFQAPACRRARRRRHRLRAFAEARHAGGRPAGRARRRLRRLWRSTTSTSRNRRRRKPSANCWR